MIRIVVLSLAASVSGCFCVDTCSRGTTFETVTLVAEPAADAGRLSFTFTKGTANLPDSYFASALAAPLSSVPATDAGWVEPTSATFVAPDRFDVTLPRPVNDLVNFRLSFPDRRDFLQCTHPGAGDSYELDLTFDRSASPPFGWKQQARLGPI